MSAPAVSARDERVRDGRARDDRTGGHRAGGRPSSRRVPRSWRASDLAWSGVVLATLLAFLEVGSRARWIDPLMVPSPSSVWSALVAGFREGVYWEPLWSTAKGTFLGFGLAAITGLTLGGILATSPRLERIMYPFIVAFQSMPKIAIAPLVVIWVGFGDLSKILIITIVSFFPILVNTMQGLRLRERDRQELVRALGASRWQIFWHVRLPGSMPYVFAGLHVSVIFALLGAIVSEFVGARDGMGVMLNLQRSVFNVPGVFAVLILLMVLGVTLNLVMKSIERRVTFWAQERDLVAGA